MGAARTHPRTPGDALRRWGHPRVAGLLRGAGPAFDDAFRGAPLAYQFSSLGSLSAKWLAEFRASLSAGTARDGGAARAPCL